MNCQNLENIIYDLAREQLIDTRVREAGLQHLDSCPTCAARLADERSLTINLRALAHEMDSIAAPQRVESSLLAAFDELQVSRQVKRPRRWSYLSAVAAAVVLAAVGIGLAAWNLKAPSREQVSNNGNSESGAVNPQPIPHDSIEPSPSVAPDVVPAKVTVRPKTASGRRGSARPKVTPRENVAALSATEITTDFMPLAYVNSASLQDGGSVVRVELPRSTIVSLGFAVNMDRYSERVKADVLMGADGLARAIRFVQ